MKKLIKFIGAFLIGIAAGLILATIGVLIFTDLSFSKYMHSLLRAFDEELWETLGFIAVLICSMIVCGFLQIIIHEAGHLVFGLLTGYRFVSFRIFNLILVCEQGKYRLKKFNVPGTGGQCLLTTPPCPVSEIPVVLYNLGGIIANLVVSLLALIPLFAFRNHLYVVTFCIMFIFMGALFFLENGIPMKIGGIGNDGYNLRQLLRHPEKRSFFAIQLQVNALVQNGTRPKDLPDNWFTEFENMDYKDPIQTTTWLMWCSQLIDRGQNEEARIELEKAMNHQKEIVSLVLNETKCELIYTSLLTGHQERAASLWTADIHKYSESYKYTTSSKQRLLMAVALFLENDTDKAQRIYDEVLNMRHKYLMQGEVAMDIDLMGQILGKEQEPK